MVLNIYVLGFCFGMLELHLECIDLNNSPIQERRTGALARALPLPLSR